MPIALAIWGFLKSKDGIYLTVILALLLGVYSWHAREVRNAVQQAKADAKVEVLEQKNTELQQMKQQYDVQIKAIQDQMVAIATQKQKTQVTVQGIDQKQQQKIQQIEKIDNSPAMIDDICTRIGGCTK